MRKYEAMFVFHPKIDEEKREKELDKLQKFLTTNEAEIVTVKSIGRKKFSHPIQKLPEGDYVVFEFKSEPSLIDKIKDNIKHNRVILRSMFIVKKEEK